jgi:hypothetical protein
VSFLNVFGAGMNARLNVLGPCGVYCGACPSYQKSCFGCSSANKEQRRTSWMGCKVRKCCYEERELQFCAECIDFPCEMIDQKLIKSHPDDKKYAYRHEIPENVKKFRALGQEAYLMYQEQNWSCPDCGGRVTFYNYQCQQCGKKITN